ncbi:MAG: hypothetical protein KJ646_04070 [Nanoarchaeota archaeon]|nr:hypothetical protein [Nanoarchaeota archaeon]MBU4116957.1 hypothetical protein [Nanoarchaeota archaeon]
MDKGNYLFLGDLVDLIDGISNRPGGLRIRDSERSRLIKNFLSTPLSNPNNFFQALPDNSDYKTYLEESGRLYSLSFRKLFLNENISAQAPLSPLDNLKLYLMKKTKVYSSDALLKILIQEPELRKSIRNAESRYSLLAKLRIQDENNTILRPFFIIPGSDGKKISFLENLYQKSYPSKRLFGLIPSRKEEKVESLYDSL